MDKQLHIGFIFLEVINFCKINEYFVKNWQERIAHFLGVWNVSCNLNLLQPARNVAITLNLTNWLSSALFALVHEHSPKYFGVSEKFFSILNILFLGQYSTARPRGTCFFGLNWKKTMYIYIHAISRKMAKNGHRAPTEKEIADGAMCIFVVTPQLWRHLGTKRERWAPNAGQIWQPQT